MEEAWPQPHPVPLGSGGTPSAGQTMSYCERHSQKSAGY